MVSDTFNKSLEASYEAPLTRKARLKLTSSNKKKSNYFFILKVCTSSYIPSCIAFKVPKDTVGAAKYFYTDVRVSCGYIEEKC